MVQSPLGRCFSTMDWNMPIGGLKEKLLAALRAGITTVFIPKDNEKDLAEIPDNVKKLLKLVPVADVDEVIAQANNTKYGLAAYVFTNDLSIGWRMAEGWIPESSRDWPRVLARHALARSAPGRTAPGPPPAGGPLAA